MMDGERRQGKGNRDISIAKENLYENKAGASVRGPRNDFISLFQCVPTIWSSIFRRGDP
jgi:hypothetical protein